jgi:hypothetical protein
MLAICVRTRYQHTGTMHAQKQALSTYARTSILALSIRTSTSILYLGTEDRKHTL